MVVFSKAEPILDIQVARNAQNLLALRINYLLIFVATPWAFIFLFLGQTRLGLIAIPVILTLVIALVLFKIGYHAWAKVLMVACTDVAVFFYASSLGGAAGIQWVYLGLIAVIYVLFDLSSWKTMIFGVMIPLVSLFLLEVGDYGWFFHVEMPATQLRFIFSVIVPMAATMIAASTHFYFRMFGETFIRLQSAYQQTQDAFHSLKESRASQVKMAEQVAYSNALRAVAHEINNPMNIIQLSLEQELATPSHQTEKVLHTLLRNVLRIKKIVGTMLDHGKDLKDVEPVSFSLTELLDDFFSISKSAGMNKLIRITLDAKPHLMAFADPHHLFQVLANLVSNSVEHTPSMGAITITSGSGLYTDPSGTERSGVWFRVSDTGPGIPSEKIKAMFNENTSDKESVHLGLGLLLVGRIVKENNGKISVTSEPGKFTAFQVWVPQG